MPFQPGIGGVEHGARLGHAARVAVGRRAQGIEHNLLLRGGHVVVEEAVEHAHAHRRQRVDRHQPHRPGMAHVQVLDDRGRLDHRAGAVHQHREALHRPQPGQRLQVGRIFQVAVLEGGVVLVQRHQHLLAVGGERVRVEDQGHGCGSWVRSDVARPVRLDRRTRGLVAGRQIRTTQRGRISGQLREEQVEAGGDLRFVPAQVLQAGDQAIAIA